MGAGARIGPAASDWPGSREPVAEDEAEDVELEEGVVVTGVDVTGSEIKQKYTVPSKSS